MMNIYLIERNGFGGMEENQAHVVLADCETEVRRLAAERCGDEGQTVWYSPEASRVVLLGAAADPASITLNGMGGPLPHGCAPVRFKQILLTESR